MQHALEKLESPARIAELDPAGTLRRMGMGEGFTLCDLGAGTGLFSAEAARMTAKPVYALEISDDMLAIIEEKKRTRNLDNMVPLKVDGARLPLDDASCDIVLAVTVFHELDDRDVTTAEVRRILTPTGKLAIVEFYGYATPAGPPLAHRITEDELDATLTRHGFVSDERFGLGENFYCAVFTQGCACA
jgi:ubiquinone/menaquinone biosynthesis C-methylase UbiE